MIIKSNSLVSQSLIASAMPVSSENIKRSGKYNAVIRLHREDSVDLPFEVIAEAKK